MPNEDVPLESNPYTWSHNTPLSDFLTKCKPSMIQDDGTKPWIWVLASPPSKEDKGQGAASSEAGELLENVTGEIERIQNDESIPIRSNKKKGVKGKKEQREQVQADATEKLKQISLKHGYVSGKWLIFAPSEKVDLIWSNVATSLVSGPLARTSAHSAKVATCPRIETPNYQHVICIYMPDVYDKDAVTEVMKTLLRNHGLNLSGVKSNMYTTIGLDSKHPSGIPSTIWKPTTLLDAAKVKEMKDAFFAENEAAKNQPKAQTTVTLKDEEKSKDSSGKAKTKPKLKKKAAEDDPFVSDEEETKKGESSQKAPSSVSKTKRRTDEDGDEEPKKKVLKL